MRVRVGVKKRVRVSVRMRVRVSVSVRVRARFRVRLSSCCYSIGCITIPPVALGGS
jgi:hypothetical protein